MLIWFRDVFNALHLCHSIEQTEMWKKWLALNAKWFNWNFKIRVKQRRDENDHRKLRRARSKSKIFGELLR